MPGSLCPKCGSLCILSVTDVAEWYRENYPSQKPGEIVSGLCFYCWKAEQESMTRDQQHNPDPNANAARIVAQSVASKVGPQRAAPASVPQIQAQAKQAAAQLGDAQASELETAWVEWSSHIQKVDERALSLLRAAFEAGFAAGRS